MIKKYFILPSFLLLIQSCFVYDFIYTPTPNKILNNSKYQWISDTTSQVIYNYERNIYSKKDIEDIKRITQEAVLKILKLISEEKYPKVIQYIIFSSKEHMKELTGFSYNAFSYPRLNAVYAVSEKNIFAIGAHEFNHVIVENMWGKSEDWLEEGFAVFSDNEWNGIDLHPLNKFLYDKKKTISFNQLINDFNKYPSLITYPQSGSVVKYIYENYGKEKFKQLWQKGSGCIRNIYGKDFSEIEKEWLNEVIKYDTNEIRYEF